MFRLKNHLLLGLFSVFTVSCASPISIQDERVSSLPSVTFIFDLEEVAEKQLLLGDLSTQSVEVTICNAQDGFKKIASGILNRREPIQIIQLPTETRLISVINVRGPNVSCKMANIFTTSDNTSDFYVQRIRPLAQGFSGFIDDGSKCSVSVHGQNKTVKFIPESLVYYGKETFGCK